MACTEVTNAIDWAKQNVVGGEQFPVTAFFTLHGGTLTAPNAPAVTSRDLCLYAVGPVILTPAGRLRGDLDVYANNGTEAAMKLSTGLLRVEIFPDGGTITYQSLTSTKQPVGGMPPTTVTTTCFKGDLLTGTDSSAVITVGLRRDPSWIIT